jgi:hypothetical protein
MLTVLCGRKCCREEGLRVLLDFYRAGNSHHYFVKGRCYICIYMLVMNEHYAVMNKKTSFCVSVSGFDHYSTKLVTGVQAQQ